MSLTANALVQHPSLGSHGIAMLGFTAIVFGVFIRDRLPITTVCLAILTLLTLGFVIFPFDTPAGPVEPTRFFLGFGHPALVAICSLMVVGHGLVVTGALEPVARRLAALVETSPRIALLALLVLPLLVSGLVNDTPVVVLLIPLIIAAATRAGKSPSPMLMPMNYAVLIGGMATTIGTSTNLIVVALAAQLGVASIGLFSFYPMVLIASVPAILYLWFVAPLLLKREDATGEKLVEPVFDAELNVEADSWLAGKQLRDVLHATKYRLPILAIQRRGHAIAKLPSLTLQAGDRIQVQDTASRLKDVEGLLRARLHRIQDAAEQNDAAVEDLKIPPSQALVAQIIVTPESALVGRTVSDSRLAEQFGVIVVGIRSRKESAHWKHHDLTSRPLHEGDVLLIQGTATAVQEAQTRGMGLLLDSRFTLPRQKKAGIALLVIACVVLLASTKILPIAVAALAGVLALILTRCLSWVDAAQALSVKIVLLVAASLALGDALELTGATMFLAEMLATVARGLPPAGVLVLLIGLMGLLTNFVSNNAAAAIGTPLGIEMAKVLGVPVEPFVLAVLFGCNLCYLTPMGYQTNLLVMNAGGYKFSDFTKVGLPLFVIMWAGLSYQLIRNYGL